MTKINLTNAEQVLYSTIYVEVWDGAQHSVGTGFFGQFILPNGRNAVALVSCRHLLLGASKVRFWCNIASPSGEPSGRFADITMQLDGQATLHPNDQIDLAGFIVHHIENEEFLKGERLFYRALPDSLICCGDKWGDASAGDDVYIAGCPSGLYDPINRTPFLRKGIVANLPKDDRSYFYIDSPTLEGSSGSPVFIDSFYSFDRKSGKYDIKNRFYFIGIISDGLEEICDDGNKDLFFGRATKSDQLFKLYQTMYHESQNR